MIELYTYPDFVAKYYDLIYEELRNPVDYNFYLKKIFETNGSILEIGVGTGRLFCDALGKRKDIYGIDLSPAMIERLKEKISSKDYFRVKVQDSRNFQLNKKFDLIVAPFRVFSHLITLDDQLSTLDRINYHLVEGGEFIFDVFNPDLSLLAKPMDLNLDTEIDLKEGGYLKRYVTAKPDQISQINWLKMKYVLTKNSVVQEETFEFPMRYYFRYELENLIALSKLKLKKVLGGFNNEPLDNNTKDFVLICEK